MYKGIFFRMSYQVNFAALGNSFVLPAAIPDQLKMISDVQLRTVVWIFRHMDAPIDAAEIAKKIGKPQEGVEEALRYWVAAGILNNDTLPEPSPAEPQAQPTAVRTLPELPDIAPSYEQIRKRCAESPELESFFNEIQGILGKTIGYDGQSTFLLMHDSYGLPFEVIFMLVHHCVDVGKTSFRYMSKIARAWGEKEIDTIEKADAAIAELSATNTAWGQFTALTGIRTPRPTAFQQALLLTWINEYHFSMEMLYQAYEIMANNCAKISFKYMDGILRRWHAQGIRTPEDLQSESSSGAGKPKPAAKRTPPASDSSYDMRETEQRAEALPVYKKRKGSDT